MSIEVLEQKIIQWSKDRGIIQHSTPAAQTLKAVSEMGELADNILKGRHDAARDDIGDIIVCLVNVAHMIGTDVESCLAESWQAIKDRRGFMSANGSFVKDEA